MLYQEMVAALYRIALTVKLAVAGFHLEGMVESHAVVDLEDVAFVAEASEEAADGFAGEASHAAEIFVGELHEEGDGEIGMGEGAVGLVRTGEVEEGAGELAGGGAVKSEATGGEDGVLVLACEG